MEATIYAIKIMPKTIGKSFHRKTVLAADKSYSKTNTCIPQESCDLTSKHTRYYKLTVVKVQINSSIVSIKTI